MFKRQVACNSYSINISRVSKRDGGIHFWPRWSDRNWIYSPALNNQKMDKIYELVVFQKWDIEQ